MKATRWAVTWQGQLVEWIENPKSDFPHDYGRWIPDGASGAEFIAALGRAVEEGGLEVILQDTLRAVTYGLPDENGEIDFRCRA